MQKGALSAGPIGLRVTHGLIGTDEWWANIQTGWLKVHTARGTIRSCSLGQHRGGPAEFLLVEQDGTQSGWLCAMEPREAESTFKPGAAVEVDFVYQELKSPFNGLSRTKVPVAIRVA
jgi:hypothetical protein